MPETKERPILFSSPMVRAILEGRKTQTRRVITPQPTIPDRFIDWCHWNEEWSTADARELEENREVVDEWTCPYGQPGDRLWVREAWRMNGNPQRQWVVFAAGGERMEVTKDGDSDHYWTHGIGRYSTLNRPSVHMPRWASRITLEVADVRVERVQDISDSDAKAEGVSASEEFENKDGSPCYTVEFEKLWRSIHGVDNQKSWDSNPWVWVVSFKRIED